MLSAGWTSGVAEQEAEEAEAVTPVGGVMNQKDVENQSGSRFSRRKEPGVCQSHQWCSAACHITKWWPRYKATPMC